MNTNELDKIRARAEAAGEVVFGALDGLPPDWPVRLERSAEDVPALLAEVERLRALITPRTDAVAVRADSARTKQVSEFLGDRIQKVRAQRNEARADRDRLAAALDRVRASMPSDRPRPPAASNSWEMGYWAASRDAKEAIYAAIEGTDSAHLTKGTNDE